MIDTRAVQGKNSKTRTTGLIVGAGLVSPVHPFSHEGFAPNKEARNNAGFFSSLPLVDAFRTFCVAPSAEVRVVLEGIQNRAV